MSADDVIAARPRSTRAFRRKLINYVFVGLTCGATLVALGALFLIMWSLISNGVGGLSLHIFTMDQPPPGDVGGLRNAIVGSIAMCGLAMTCGSNCPNCRIKH